MPGFNRTGPAGAGPMTGGGRGYCGTEAFGLVQQQWRRVGRGLRYGGGRGFGWGYGLRASQITRFAPMTGYRPPMEASAEMRILKDRAEFLRSELDHIQSRIAGLDKHTRPDTE